MNTVLTAGALGAISGSRSMLAPALLARAFHSSTATPVLALLAAGEMMADKLPALPARTEPMPLAGRLMSGALVGAAICSGRRRVACTLAGAAGAVAASFALTQLRVLATRQRIPNAAAGFVEDALAIGAGLLLLKTQRRAIRR